MCGGRGKGEISVPSPQLYALKTVCSEKHSLTKNKTKTKNLSCYVER